MGLYIWYEPLDGIGEACIDLSVCRRFVCDEIGEDSDRTLIIYETPDPKWIEYRDSRLSR